MDAGMDAGVVKRKAARKPRTEPTFKHCIPERDRRILLEGLNDKEDVVMDKIRELEDKKKTEGESAVIMSQIEDKQDELRVLQNTRDNLKSIKSCKR